MINWLKYTVAGAATTAATVLVTKYAGSAAGGVAGTAVGGFFFRLFHLAAPPTP